MAAAGNPGAEGTGPAILRNGDPVLLQHILSFLSLDQAAGDDNGTTFRTLRSLLCAAPGLGRILGPANTRFWQAMVLAHFDFRCHYDRCQFVHETLEEDLEDDDGDEDSRTIARAVRAWEARRTVPQAPAEKQRVLEETMRLWDTIATYFRPSQFMFLTEIQSGKLPLSAWPAGEDPYTLYRDLLMILVHFEVFEDSLWTMLNDDEDDTNMYRRLQRRSEHVMTACLFPAMDPAKAAQIDKFTLLEHCGIKPHFWGIGGGDATERWRHLDTAPALNEGENESAMYLDMAPAEAERMRAVFEQVRTTFERARGNRDASESVHAHEMDVEEVPRDDGDEEWEDMEDDDSGSDEEPGNDGDNVIASQFRHLLETFATCHNTKLLEFNDPEDADAEYLTFPVSTPSKRATLKSLVRKYFDDWRTVLCVDLDGGPMLFVGRSKCSGRWIGYIGKL